MISRTIAKVLTLTSILFAISTGSVSSAPKLSLTTAVHNVVVPLQVFDIIITTPTRGFVWNFTVDLTGKDPGSDRFNLVVDASGSSREGSVPLVALFSDQNLTKWLSTSLTTHSSQELAYWATEQFPPFPGGAVNFGASTLTFLPPVGGTYHVVAVNPVSYFGNAPGVTTNLHFEIHGQETWTTTSVD